ncbi:hypothetical protein UJ101_00884 [Flavobacteriaceae bacterium UJ101]|nr:hypothetical protein UJ101_00884 [Flavobacteriaceae bacterium UJ101]
MKKTFLWSLLVGLGFFTYSHAQNTIEGFNNPIQPQPKTIKEVIKDASSLDKKDTLVQITGFFVEQINHEDYWFSDSKDRIHVSLDDDIQFPSFNKNQKVTIVGEVDYDFMNGTEIEIEQIITKPTIN